MNAVVVNTDIKTQWIEHVYKLQDIICNALEQLDGGAIFHEDLWKREGGGGGRTRVIANGNIFEKGGVNVSVVHGAMTEAIAKQLNVKGSTFFACGLSLVIHPESPMVPTAHANWRYFEVQDEAGNITDRWFGGGADLTPYYLLEDDAIHFHRTFKQACDAFDETYYPAFKKQCDDYFVNHHRNGERRGVGGVFYDYLQPTSPKHLQHLFDLAKANGDAFLPAYVPIVERRKNKPYSDANVRWQEIRRGRYVEFNLLHDKGTLFGIRSNGRTESILMSLPPRVRFEYDHRPKANSNEAKLLDVLLHPRDWVA